MFDSSTRTLVVVGAQWGDEGKGKLVDVLAESNDRWAKESAAKQNAVESVVESAVGMYDEDDLPDFIKDLANAFDIDMTIEFDVTVTLTYNLTVTAPRTTSIREVRAALLWEGNPTFTLDNDTFEITDGIGDDARDFDIEICHM